MGTTRCRPTWTVLATWSLGLLKKYTNSYYKLGIMYRIGQGIEQNNNKAFYYYQLAVKENHLEAKYNIAYMYYHGLGVKKNESKAIEIYNELCNLNFPIAYYTLGLIYENIDSNKSISYYKNALKNKNMLKNDIIGNIYYSLSKLLPDESNNYYKLASKYNHNESLFLLGIDYKKKGEIEKAKQFLSLASANNHILANKVIQNM